MKSIFRSSLAMVLAVLICLGMVACADGSGNTNPTKPVIDLPTKPTGGESTQPTGGDDWLNNIDGLPEKLDNPNIKIVYWYNEKQYQYDTSKKPDVYDPILEAIPYFEKKYGGEVEVIYAAWNDMLSTVIGMQEGSNAPDLFEVYDETLYSVILSGVAMDISDYVTDKDMGYYAINQETFQWKGKTYAIPLKPYTMYIMFNRDLFDLEGLKAPDEMFRDGEWNWANFKDVCKKLTKTVDGEVTQLAFGSWEEDILRFMYSNDATLLNVDTKTGAVTSNLGSPNAQATLDYLKDLMGSFVFGNDMFGWFDNGNLAMIRGKEYPVELPFEVGMVPFPTGDNASGKNLAVYPQGMAVPTGSKNPAGAVAFMRIVNELQQIVGNKKEASRIGQENYDMIYASDVKLVYNYDKGLNDIGTILATIVNYLGEGVPAATINANVESKIQSEIDLMYKK